MTRDPLTRRAWLTPLGWAELTDKQRERLLTPCECGHTINDHGSLVACWRCEDEGGDCSTPFETLLAARIEALLAEARAEGAREAADEIVGRDGTNPTARFLRDRAEQTGGAS
ncbi:MAG TPA: hypothetical protein VFJ21_00180 [Mycobacteriales bacterium]|nr:hypothetical protein [Mycobacteriales bacterium]